MQLRKKTIIIIGLTLVGMILLIYLASQVILLQSYTDIEDREVRSALNSSLSGINYDLSTLDSVTIDYSYWDDTYWYAQNGDSGEYVGSNFVDATMINQKLNLVLIANASDQVMYARGYDLENGKDSPVPAGIIESLTAGSPLFRSSAADNLHGIIILQGGPMLISAYPILPSEGIGKPAGTMIMGRFLGDAEVSVLNNMSGISIAVYPYSATGMPDDFKLAEGLADSASPVIVAPVDADTISGYTIIDDIYGKPALVLRVDEPRIAYQQAQGTLLYIVVSLLISGLVFSIVTMFFLERMVVSRTIRLNKDVGKIGPDAGTMARVSVSGDDEVAELASTINRTLDALEASRRQLQKNEERLRSMVENINEVVWETDDAMKLTYISQKATNVFGYVPDKLLGRSPFDLVKPEERGHIQSTIHDMNARNDSFAGVEFWIMRPDGTRACIEVGGNVIRDPAGKITGYRGIARDVTERRRADETLRVSEERLRLCAATARFGTIDWDLVNDRQVWSPETYAIFGLPQDTPLTFDGWNSLIYPGDRQNSLDKMMLDPAGPGEHAKEFRIIRASDGSIRWIFARIRIFFEGEGEGRRAVRVLGAVQDITDRKHAEEAMAASLDEKDVLLKEIHHRVKNNLQIISSLLSLQSGTVKGENQATMFRESQDRIRSMALIHEKLYQSKDISRIDFAGYVRSLITYLVHSYAAGRGVHVIIDIENVLLGIDTAIPCGLIINELVSNCFKYAFRDGRPGELRIGLVRDGDRYVLTVSDNGVGFPPGIDFRDTASLGLQLVNTLVSQLEGTIELDAQRGTRFKITFTESK